MKTYDDALKVKDALLLYFSRYHFENGGYHLKWFKIKLGFLYIPMPNIKARIDAVKIHDIHHLVTEYEATLQGEAEIGGWEIGSGCEKYTVAWVLNFGSFFYGMIFFPRFLFRAFLRGRRTATNLYFNIKYDEALLNKTVGELRRTIEPGTKKNSFKDYLSFAFYCLFILTSAYVFFLCLYKIFLFLTRI
jgi:hypothetical protein